MYLIRGVHMERDSLKSLLITVQANHFKPPKNISLFQLSLNMLDFLGDTDSELRDDLIYSTFAHWFFHNTLSVEEIHTLLNKVLDDKHLFFGIGKTNDDSVFMRTFSLLIISLSLYVHRSNPYLKKEEVLEIFNKILFYFKEEKDLRGYIEDKGWAHSTAHTADVLNQLSRCIEIQKEEMRQILDAIRDKIFINNYTYIHREDERLVTAFTGVMNRKLIDTPELIEWIKSFSEIEKTSQHILNLTLSTNIKNFLRSLYFRILGHKEYRKILNATKEVLERLK